MTPLRQRMLDDMHLRGLSPKTQACYLFAVQAPRGRTGTIVDAVAWNAERAPVGQ